MDDKKQNTPSRSDIAADILQGATAALAYTDEEITSTLSPNEAQEFIELRNRVLNDIGSAGKAYTGDEHSIPLAAEEETPYK